MAATATHQTSPSIQDSPASSFSFISGDSSDEFDYDGNDIVLSASWDSMNRGTGLGISSGSDDEQDFVLILPGSSVLMSPATSTFPATENNNNDNSDDEEEDDEDDEEDEDEGRGSSVIDSLALNLQRVHLATPTRRSAVRSWASEHGTESPLGSPRSLTPIAFGVRLPTAGITPPRSTISTPTGFDPIRLVVSTTLTHSQKRNRRRRRAARRRAIAANRVVLPVPVTRNVATTKPKVAKLPCAVSHVAKHVNVATPTMGTVLDESSAELYDHAVQYMNSYVISLTCESFPKTDNSPVISSSFLAQPPKSMTPANRLALVQALLIELGVTPVESLVPRSHRAAKTLLKSTVHINILDYVALREQGLDALRGVMKSSDKELRQDLKNKKRRAPLGMVKKKGLNVLLALTRGA